MHEYPITESICRIAAEELEKSSAKKVLEIKIVVGELTGLVPECIQSYFDLISKGTKVEGAILKIEKRPVNIKCNDCGFESLMDLSKNNCLSCGSSNLKLIGGREYYIESMEVEEWKVRSLDKF